MYKLKSACRFEASHYLPHCPQQEKRHSHRWTVTVVIETSDVEDKPTGYTASEYHIQRAMYPHVEFLHGKCLNEVLGKDIPPTPEALARRFFHILLPEIDGILTGDTPYCLEVRVDETEFYGASFSDELWRTSGEEEFGTAHERYVKSK